MATWLSHTSASRAHQPDRDFGDGFLYVATNRFAVALSRPEAILEGGANYDEPPAPPAGHPEAGVPAAKGIQYSRFGSLLMKGL